MGFFASLLSVKAAYPPSTYDFQPVIPDGSSGKAINKNTSRADSAACMDNF